MTRCRIAVWMGAVLIVQLRGLRAQGRQDVSTSKPKIVITGLPGCGKTTAVTEIVAALAGVRVAGFYTEEIREGDARKGFGWRRLDGPSGILSHVSFKGRPRVGKYGVDVAGFEESVLGVLDIEQTEADLYVIDEIGKMECLSQRFVTAVRRLLASDRAVLATVAKKGTGLIDQVKRHPDIQLLNLTRERHEQLVGQIVQLLSGL